jgi:hypothetical protein
MRKLLLLLVGVVLIATTHVTAQTELIFEEDFDSYPTGVLPSGWSQVWSGAGWQYQVVTDEQYYSPPNSFKMKGTTNWGACVERAFSSPPSQITFQAKVRTASGSGGEWGEQTTIGLWRRNEGEWGTAYCQIDFVDDVIKLYPRSGGGFVDLMPYQRDTWYDVRVIYDAQARTASVWVDNDLVVSDIALGGGSLGYNAIRLHNGWGGIVGYYDDIKVWAGGGPPPQLVSVSGRVVTENGTSVAGAVVSFFALGQLDIREIITQADGTYQIMIPAGTYLILAAEPHHVCYPTYIRAIESSTVLDFTARPSSSFTDSFDEALGGSWTKADWSLHLTDFTKDEEHVYVEDGSLNIKQEMHPYDSRYFGGEVYRPQESFYGSYRAKMRVDPVPNQVAALFVFSGQMPDANGVPQLHVSEIDVELSTGCPDKVLFSCYDHWWKGSAFNDHVHHENIWYELAGGESIHDWHTYGFDWYSDRVDFFVDGEDAGTIDRVVPNNPASLRLNYWVPDYAFCGTFDPPDRGQASTMQVDWVSYRELLDIPANAMVVIALCPIDLEVMSPTGDLYSKNVPLPECVAYKEIDFNLDGDIDDLLFFYEPLSGLYRVKVIPEQSASPTDSVTVIIQVGNKSVILTSNTMLRDIPTQGYLFNTQPFAFLSGFVTTDPLQSLPGVNVDIYDSTSALWQSVVTDDSGYYHIDSIPNGDYTATVVTPLGYQADQETKQFTIHHVPVTIDFNLTELEITPQQRSRAYWAHQLHRALKNRPKDYSLEDFSNFADLINIHFNQNQLNPVDFYTVPQPANQADSLRILKRLLHMRNTGEWEPFLKRLAKSQLMALILNVVSGKVSQTHGISADGRTVSQIITYCDMLINDEIDPPDNNGCPGHGSPWFRYIYASFMLVKANLGLTVPAGMIPEDVVQIAYKQHGEEKLPTEFVLQQNCPNPFNPATEISFSLPNAAHVKLEIFNIMGQKVTTLLNRHLEAGNHSVSWDGNNVASGVYFYRLQAGDMVDTKKMVLLK